MTGKFIGYIVEYESLVGSAFLLVEDWHREVGKPCFSIETATVFDDKDSAERFARANQTLFEKGYSTPGIRPVWEITRRTVYDPAVTHSVVSDALKTLVPRPAQ